MQKTMAEVRKVAEAIGWSPETLARAWEAAGIAITADPRPEQAVERAAIVAWLRQDWQGADGWGGWFADRIEAGAHLE
jgi:hypothetical protein